MKKKLQVSLLSTALSLLLTINARAQNVDEFTGSFGYGVPLLVVPSPDGAGIPISAGYSSGIGVEQRSSEIGLGWSLNAGGMISRSVNGIADDWKNKTVARADKPGFGSHYGAASFTTDAGAVGDFYQSKHKIDTPAFHFPDYDSYYVSAPGVSGSLQLNYFEFVGIGYKNEEYTLKVDDFYKFTKKPQFSFSGDFADEVNSRHYPWSGLPLTQSTPLRLPGDNISGSAKSFNGAGYNDENYAADTYNRNRLRTSNYVEYFTNQEIQDHYSGTPINGGFIDFKTGHTRTSGNCDMTGIGAFRVTDASGTTYHFSLPVYINYTVNGNYPLKNNYSVPEYGSLVKTSSTGNYRILNADSLQVEHKQNEKYASHWLLTAITGPGYADADNNGIVNEKDKGYWVSYDWQLWTKKFIDAAPFYGSDYSFSHDEDLATFNSPVDAVGKLSGKYLSFDLKETEIYYLNKIKTASHTAVFVRDLRKDNFSAYEENYTHMPDKVNTGASPATRTSWFGTIYDPGGPNANYSSSAATSTISLTGADKVKLTFQSFSVLNDGDKLEIYDGPDLNSPQVTGSPFHNSNIPTVIISSGSALTLRFTANSTGYSTGYEADWEAFWNNGLAGWPNNRPAVMPQLKLNKIVLLDNKDLAALPLLPVSLFDPLWDFTQTEVSSGTIYLQEWYSSNQVAIENVSLKTIEFKQDYSLNRKYYNNVNVLVNATHKVSPPSSVHSKVSVGTGKYEESGKLTLNKIVVLEEKHTQLLPSYKFHYNHLSSNDNPDYNPQAVDYWGFHKSDISTKGYSSYATATSGAYTDAWSLRKITTPIGGDITIDYESNDYEKVIKDAAGGGFRGAARVYPIENVTAVSGALGEDWLFTLEDDVADFWSLVNSPPSGTVQNAVVPFNSVADACFYANDHYISLGTGTIVSSPSYKVSELDMYVTTSGEYFNNNAVSPNLTPNAYFTNGPCIDENLLYTGNGFFNFDLPIGNKVYGGGPRVKSISAINFSDVYKTEYVYEEGVALSEPDRFERSKKRKDRFNSMRYHKIRAIPEDPHILPPSIGYTKVTVKDMGQTTQSNGTTISRYITSDTGIDNYEPVIIFIDNSGESGRIQNTLPPYNDTTYILQVSDKFSRYWGLMAEQEVRDVNNNRITLTRNEYASTQEGAIVENFNFFKEKNMTVSPGGGTVYIQNNNISILRSYPVRLNKTTTYKNGIESVSEFTGFDKITGQANKIKVTTPNSGTTEIETKAAFGITGYEQMGAKSVNSTYRNILSAGAESKIMKDNTLTGNSDFISFSVYTFTDDLNTRKFNTVSNLFENSIQADYYWISNRSYTWMGPLGKYGLFDAASLTSFNYANLSANGANWRFGSESTLLDAKGHALENRGFNNRFSASKYGYKNKFLIAEAGNSNYESFTFTGFEDTTHFVENTQVFSGGEVKLNANNVIMASDITREAHTGSFYIKVPNGSTGPLYKVKYNGAGANGEDLGLMRDRTYRASVWVHEDSPADAKLHLELNGTNTGTVSASIQKSATGNVQIGEWILLNLDFTVPANYTSTGGTNNDFRVYVTPGGTAGTNAYFDDLRLHPVDAGMNSYVYDVKTGRKTAVLDNNNFATIYKYDAAGRLLQVSQEIEGVGLKKIQQKTYNFARAME